MRELSLHELRRRYVELGRPLPAEVEEKLRCDGRSGARAILQAVQQRRHENRAEGQRLRVISRYERELWSRGCTLVAGVDEAGMSPLAGPVAAGAVILHVGWKLAGVDDSKKLDRATRERLAVQIKDQALAWSVAFVEPDEIDAINIYHAGLLAMQRAVQGLARVPEHLLIDARRIKALPMPQDKIIRGDEKSISIACASILAKTSRDALMVSYDARYPGYGFARHKGYPAREHFAALAALGPCPIHRRSFDPVRRALAAATAAAQTPG